MSSDEKVIYFTDDEGTVRRKDLVTGDSSVVQFASRRFATDIAISHANSEIAITFKRNGGRKPVFQIYDVRTAKPTSLTIEGALPRFTNDGSTVYFARPARYVPQIGFGGNLWVDWDVWALDRRQNVERRITDGGYFLVSDIALHPVSNEVVFSADASEQDSRLVENIFRIAASGEVVKAITCEDTRISMCGGRPAFFPRGDEMIFVSDRHSPHHYGLFILGADSEIRPVTLPSEVRYVTNPVVGCRSRVIFVLLAKSFGWDGTPRLELWELRNDGDVNPAAVKIDL